MSSVDKGYNMKPTSHQRTWRDSGLEPPAAYEVNDEDDRNLSKFKFKILVNRRYDSDTQISISRPLPKGLRPAESRVCRVTVTVTLATICLPACDFRTERSTQALPGSSVLYEYHLFDIQKHQVVTLLPLKPMSSPGEDLSQQSQPLPGLATEYVLKDL